MSSHAFLFAVITVYSQSSLDYWQDFELAGMERRQSIGGFTSKMGGKSELGIKMSCGNATRDRNAYILRRAQWRSEPDRGPESQCRRGEGPEYHTGRPGPRSV